MPTAPAGDCAAADGLRRHARARQVESKRLAALRAYEDAQSLCPDAQPETARAVSELRAYFASERSSSATTLLEQARSAASSGDAGRARALEERAVYAREVPTSERLAAWAPSPGPREAETFWLADARRLIALEQATIFHTDTNAVETLPTNTAPRHFAGNGRLITRLSSLDHVEIWDIARAKKLAELELADAFPEVYALSPNGSLLLYQRDLWDVATGRKLSRLKDTVEAAEFWDDATLAVVSGVRLTLYRVPSLEPVLGFVAAESAAAAVAFGMGKKSASRVGSLQFFGESGVLDTTLRCSVGNTGVPFRLCRELYEGTRVVSDAFAPSTP